MYHLSRVLLKLIPIVHWMREQEKHLAVILIRFIKIVVAIAFSIPEEVIFDISTVKSSSSVPPLYGLSFRN